jgi:hypothetical protein
MVGLSSPGWKAAKGIVVPVLLAVVLLSGVMPGGRGPSSLAPPARLGSDGRAGISLAPGPSYVVWFNETGLPSGTDWSVTLNGSVGSSTGSSIQFAESIGVYNYSLGVVPGYQPNVTNGNVTVTAVNQTVWIGWSESLYEVTFAEVGLSGPFRWGVELGTSWNNTTAPASVGFQVPNGTYPVALGPESGYVVLHPPSPVSVTGLPVNVLVTWNETFNVTFTETGLPANTEWNVTLNGTPLSSTQSSINFPGNVNGTYPFVVPGVSGYGPNPASGNVTVTGTNLTVSIGWSARLYPVTFHETGLPPGTNWGVDLGTTWRDTSAPSPVYFQVPNGTYPVAVGPESGYVVLRPPSPVHVTGSPVSVLITWNQTFNVTFKENGLPATTEWNVTLNGTRLSSTQSSINFPGNVNGTYPFVVPGVSGYAPNPASGNVTVSGQNQSIVISWTARLYPVTFHETGLPPGTNWTVCLNSYPVAYSMTPWVNFTHANATDLIYSFIVPGWTANITHGDLNIAGEHAYVNVTFTVTTYAAQFTEIGLNNTRWYVEVNGSLESSLGPVIVFNLPNGSYSFTIYPPAGYTVSPSSGPLPILGAGNNVTVYFDTATYPVTFTSTGLPANTTWGVMLAGYLQTTNTSSIQFVEPNGTFPFSVSLLPGYLPKPASGNIHVHGLPYTQPISWSPFTYVASFVETGLPTGTPWGVEVDSAWSYGHGSTIAVSVTNGTHAYQYELVPGYRPANSSGTVDILGAPVTIPSSWSPVLYSITFTESGLPYATDWSLVFDGVTYAPLSASVTVAVPNGTYPFSVTTPNSYVGNPSSGWVTVKGEKSSVLIAFAKTPSTLETLLKDLPYVLGALAAVVLLVVLVVTLRRRRRGKPPAIPPWGASEAEVGSAGGGPSDYRQDGEGRAMSGTVSRVASRARLLIRRFETVPPGSERAQGAAEETQKATKHWHARQVDETDRALRRAVDALSDDDTPAP